MRFRPLYILPMVLTVLLMYSCAGNERRGEKIYVPGAGGLPGYTIYIRDVEPPVTKVYEIEKNKETKEFLSQKSDGENKIGELNKEEKGRNSLSSLYYYRSPNPNRLTRIRLRRF